MDDKLAGWILWNETCFPFGDTDTIKRHICEALGRKV